MSAAMDIVEQASRYVGRADASVACDHIVGLIAEVEDLRAALMRAQAVLVQVGILNASGGHADSEIDKAIREYAVEQSKEK